MTEPSLTTQTFEKNKYIRELHNLLLDQFCKQVKGQSSWDQLEKRFNPLNNMLVYQLNNRISGIDNYKYE